MIKIFETVNKLKVKIEDKGGLYLEGFQTCLNYFELGIKKSTQFNLNLKIRDLEKENQDLKESLRAYKEKRRNIEHFIDNNPFSLNVTDIYKPFIIQTVYGNFEIVTNMNTDTMYKCLINFGLRYGYSTSEEAKSKLLQYINSKNFAGFEAFKDIKSYNRKFKENDYK